MNVTYGQKAQKTLTGESKKKGMDSLFWPHRVSIMNTSHILPSNRPQLASSRSDLHLEMASAS